MMKTNLILYALSTGVILGSVLGRTAAGHWVTACGALLLLIAVGISYIQHTKKEIEASSY